MRPPNLDEKQPRSNRTPQAPSYSPRFLGEWPAFSYEKLIVSYEIMNFSYEKKTVSYEMMSVSYEKKRVSYKKRTVSYETADISYETSMVSHGAVAASDGIYDIWRVIGGWAIEPISRLNCIPGQLIFSTAA